MLNHQLEQLLDFGLKAKRFGHGLVCSIVVRCGFIRCLAGCCRYGHWSSGAPAGLPACGQPCSNMVAAGVLCSNSVYSVGSSRRTDPTEYTAADDPHFIANSDRDPCDAQVDRSVCRQSHLPSRCKANFLHGLGDARLSTPGWHHGEQDLLFVQAHRRQTREAHNRVCGYLDTWGRKDESARTLHGN